jgi:hypothetical protein
LTACLFFGVVSSSRVLTCVKHAPRDAPAHGAKSFAVSELTMAGLDPAIQLFTDPDRGLKDGCAADLDLQEFLDVCRKVIARHGTSNL